MILRLLLAAARLPRLNNHFYVSLLVSYALYFNISLNKGSSNLIEAVVEYLLSDDSGIAHLLETGEHKRVSLMIEQKPSLLPGERIIEGFE